MATHIVLVEEEVHVSAVVGDLFLFVVEAGVLAQIVSDVVVVAPVVVLVSAVGVCDAYVETAAEDDDQAELKLDVARERARGSGRARRQHGR